MVLYAARPEVACFSPRVHDHGGSGWCTALGHYYGEVSRPFRASMATVRPQPTEAYLSGLQNSFKYDLETRERRD
jgi:hypothetical protein